MQSATRMVLAVQGGYSMEGITQESVNSVVKQRRKQRSVFYRWWLQRQIKKCHKQLKNVIKNPLQMSKVLIQQKKYIDELAYIDAMRFKKRTCYEVQ